MNCLDLQEEIKMDKSSNKFITTNQHPKSNTKAFHHQLMSLLLKITNLEEAAALNFLRSHIKNPVQGSSHLNQLVTIHKKLRKLSINIYGRKITKFPSTTTILTKFNSLFSISSLILETLHLGRRLTSINLNITKKSDHFKNLPKSL